MNKPFLPKLCLLRYFVTAAERKLPIRSHLIAFQGQPLLHPTLVAECDSILVPWMVTVGAAPSELPTQQPLHIQCSGSPGMEATPPAQSPCPRVGPRSHTSQHCTMLSDQVSPQLCAVQDQRYKTMHVPACFTWGPVLNPPLISPGSSPSRCSWGSQWCWASPCSK